MANKESEMVIIDKELANKAKQLSILDRAKSIREVRKKMKDRVLTGAVMERLRVASGASQSLVSRDLGVSITAYRQWETDTAIPTEKSYRSLEDYFGVYDDNDIDEILQELHDVGANN